MRPLRLVISGFGPYAGKNMVLPMESLGECGLYLVTGDTGAGKTTIFDAITFALYGQASGVNREQSMLRSKYAAPDTPTEVELTFSHRGKEYCVRRNPGYQRPAKRGDGMTAKKAAAELTYPDGRVVTKIKDVDQAIHEILGIDYGQFSQIVMLAQGDFLKLLLADTKDRQKIFRDLFQTQYYQTLQLQMKDKWSEIYGQCQDARRSVNQYIEGILCDEGNGLSEEVAQAKAGERMTAEVLEILDQLLYEDTTSVEKLSEDLTAVQNELDQVNANLGKAEEQKKAVQRLQKLQQEDTEADVLFVELQQKKEDVYQKQDRQKELREEIARMEQERSDYDVLEELKQQQLCLAKELEQEEDLERQRQGQLAKSGQQLEAGKQEQASLAHAGEIREQLLRKKAELEDRQKQLQTLGQEHQKYCFLLKKQREKQEKYQNAQNRAEELEQIYSQMNRAFLDGQAGIIASRLLEGEPCPVCGAVVHPHLAVVPEEVPTEQALEQSKQQQERAAREAAKCSEEAGKIRGQLAEGEAQLQKQLHSLHWLMQSEDGQEELQIRSIDRLDTPADRFVISSVNSGHIDLQQMLDSALADLRRIQGETDAQIQAEEQRVQRRDILAEQLPKQEAELQALESVVQQHREQITQYKIREQTLQEQMERLRAKLRFGSKQAAEAQREKYTAELTEIVEAMESIERTYQEAKQVKAERGGQIKSLTEQLSQAEKIDQNAEVMKQTALTQKRQQISEEMNRIHVRKTTNQKIREKIECKSRELETLESEYQWVNALYQTVNGQIRGKERIMLETYIQTTYLDRIVRRANLRLMIMSDGQYELKRRTEAENNRGQSGLELNVVDHYNGSERSVKTLSGGESFLASLSLALGLSDEVQSSAGGIQMDTLFVDEGFGSLDSDALQQAYKALVSLTDGHRLVGIISHVAELKEKIDQQIVVTKDKRGGSVAKIQV